MPRFSPRFSAFPVYPLAHIPARKKALIAAGVDVIDLGAGDADLPPPPKAVAALQAAAEVPAMQRYGFGMGYVPFREAISAWMQTRFGQRVDPMSEIVPLLGSKEGLAHIAFAYLGAGDVAVIPDPAYQAYLGGTLMSDATPYVYALRPRTNFLVDLDEIPHDVLSRTRVLYLNYPNNPTAAIAPRDYLERVVQVCRERDILLVYDNAYSEMGFDGYVPPSIFEIDGAREVAIEFHSLSKTYNMTGWRCAWAVRQPAHRGGAREGEELPRYRTVHGGPAGRHRRARRVGALGARQRRGVPRATRCRGRRLPRERVRRGGGAEGLDVPLGPAPRGRPLDGVP